MNRTWGSTLIVIGTTTGAGMLALPVIGALSGTVPSLLVLFFCWAFLYTTARIFLEVTLACPGEPNMISMAKKTLGPWGQGVCWILTLVLLYSLNAAYIAGSGPIFLSGLQTLFGPAVPFFIAPLPLMILFGVFIYLGTHMVDGLNRVLLLGKAFAYLFLIIALPSHIDPSLWLRSEWSGIWKALPVVVTAYGFHTVIPSLSTYLGHNKKELKKVLFWGSFIPFAVYAVWDLFVLGILPLEGENGLMTALAQGDSASLPLSRVVHSRWISIAAFTFPFFAIMTSFLGVSLSLSDFLTDGLRLRRFSIGREVAALFTFIPPFLFVLSYPKGFIAALQFAGAIVAVLLCFLPALMGWKLRGHPFFHSHKGRFLLGSVMGIALFLAALDFCV